jgi:hypothetical protein
LELLAEPEVEDKDEIVYFLVHVALGYESHLLPKGVDPLAFRGDLEAEEAGLDEEARRECRKYGTSPQTVIDCYDAVLGGCDTFIRLLGAGPVPADFGPPLLAPPWKGGGLAEPSGGGADDARVRRAAAYALAWFPEAASESLPVLRLALRREAEPAAIANLVLVIGLLARACRDRSAVDVVRPYLASTSPLLVRVCAGIAAAGDPLEVEVVDALLEGVVHRAELAADADGLRFYIGDLGGYACVTLSAFGSAAADRIVPVLCAALEGLERTESLSVTRALLELTVPDRTRPVLRTPIETLPRLERAALEAIARHGAREEDGMLYGDYSNLAGWFGLPPARRALLRYLGTS